MSIYIKLSTLEFPLYQGDIRLEYPDMGEQFVVPDTYAEVIVEEPPFISSTQKKSLSAPYQQDGVWRCDWSVGDLTQEELDYFADKKRQQRRLPR